MISSEDCQTWGFVLNPKCASLSIEKALAPYAQARSGGRRHQIYEPWRGDLRNVVGVVVRHPCERIVSGYEYWKRHGPNPDLTFHEFVFPEHSEHHLFCQPHLFDFVRTPQTVWVGEATNVIRYDNLADGWFDFCNDAGLPQIPLQRINAGPVRKHWSEYYDRFTRRAIEDRFEADFRLFGY